MFSWELGRKVGVRSAADEARAPERPEMFSKLKNFG